MKTSTRLDKVVFQLTPTRTRCDLIIYANEKSEKIASGLVNPFLAHLKSAQDQMDRGGYSIILEPELGSNATWFTKGLVERFVRFVSTPEVLERVYTLESEILQIDEAIAIQSKNDIGLSTVNDHQQKPVEHIGGSRPLIDSNEEKAIVLYSPSTHPPESNGSTIQDGNSKVQLMKVLEARKSALQKEQGMAFARAVAAGFGIDHMAPLLSFSESFGALRLMDACSRFMDLWKRKHETGQWVEVEAAEAMSNRSDFATTDVSGIVLSNAVNQQSETLDINGKGGAAPSTAEKHPLDQQLPPGHLEYIQGQFPHPVFPPWSMHSPFGPMPVPQGYPMQGIPYYQSYPGDGTVFQSPYPSGEGPVLGAGQRIGRRHSMDSNIEHETCNLDSLKTRCQDDSEMGKEVKRESRRNGSRSSNKKSGMVVIRNINYITSKKQDSSGSESQSASGSDIDEYDEDLVDTTLDEKQGKPLRSSKEKGSRAKSMHKYNSSSKEETVYGKEDAGHWQAFQTYLLKGADEAERAVDQDAFATEKEARLQRQQNSAGHDPVLFNRQTVGNDYKGSRTDMPGVSRNLARMTRTSTDELLISRRKSHVGGQFMDGQMNVHSADIAGRRSAYRRTANDDFLIQRHEINSGYTGSPSDPLPVNGFEQGNNDLNRRSSQNMDDDSYLVSLRSTSFDQDRAYGRNSIDMEAEVPSSVQRKGNLSNRDKNMIKYEPDDLSLMPDRGAEMGTAGYDPALDYGIQVRAKNGASMDKMNKGVVSRKLDKNQKSKLTPGSSDRKKTGGPIRKGKPSKSSPLDEAKARADRLRTYKADLQKMKKDKEAEEIKRLEALKLARQKRIASRGSSVPAQSASQQARKQLPTKLSPNSHKGSKFNDSEPGYSSPLQRFRTVSAGSNDSFKASKAGKLSTGSHSSGNRLSRSVPSLLQPKKENGIVTPGEKSSATRIRRLSEPKISSSTLVSSIKPRKIEQVSKPKISNGPEKKKISAIVKHDKSKVASLPELKIKTLTRSDVSREKSAAKEIPQKVSGGKLSPTSEGAERKRNSEKFSSHIDGNDDPIIEKTVVVLENEKPSVPYVDMSAQHMEMQEENSSSCKVRDENENKSEYAAIQAPISALVVDVVGREDAEHRLQKQQTVYEATTENVSRENRASKLSSMPVADKTYQAPYARVSSIEDPCTRNSEYGKAPIVSLSTVIDGTETRKTQLSDSKTLKLEKIPEALDKPQGKESSKGFRRLLKFGKKNSAAGERYIELDDASLNGSKADDGAAKAATAEVHTLKNLISRDETPAAGSTPPTTSRHFSLLSPFRSKTSGRKPTA